MQLNVESDLNQSRLNDDSGEPDEGVKAVETIAMVLIVSRGHLANVVRLVCRVAAHEVVVSTVGMLRGVVTCRGSAPGRPPWLEGIC